MFLLLKAIDLSYFALGDALIVIDDFKEVAPAIDDVP
jgi:hypothetical protein